MKKTVLITYLVIFIIYLVTPILFSDFKGGGLLLDENRLKATFPKLHQADRRLNHLFFDEAKCWIDDNIAFRSKAIRINDLIRPFFCGATSTRVDIGKNGFYFLKSQGNIEIGKGAKLLDSQQAERVIKCQSDTAQRYAKYGAEYFLVLTPSKASIYTENLYGAVTSHKTMCDQISEFLARDTEVKVINTKPRILDAKKKETYNLFWKTDTHWNQLGSYYAYLEIYNQLKQSLILTDEPIKCKAINQELLLGDTLKMLGRTQLSDYEIAPKLDIKESKSILVNKGVKYEQLQELRKLGFYGEEISYYRNDEGARKTLLILGDSMWESKRNLPIYLAEHFETLVYVRIKGALAHTYHKELVELLQPDVVIFGSTERFLNTRLVKDSP